MALTTSLISYWKLAEASGNALDAHSTNDLTETSGTIDAVTGKITGARDFEAGDTEYFTRADNTDLSVGDIDFTFTAWVQLESDSRGWVFSKWNGTGNQRAYGLVYNSATDRFQFLVSPDGVNNAVATANNFGVPSLATWYFVVCWHDATANTINIQVNNGTANSTSHTTGVIDNTADFRLGALGDATENWDGLICEVGFWKRVLTTQERTDLYNGGAGLAYPFAEGQPAIKRMGGVRFASYQQIGTCFGGVW